MKIYIATIDYPYNDYSTTIGVFSSNEKAQNAINESVKQYQKLTGRKSDDKPINDIEEYILDEVTSK
jgi:hypothetical protein